MHPPLRRTLSLAVLFLPVLAIGAMTGAIRRIKPSPPPTAVAVPDASPDLPVLLLAVSPGCPACRRTLEDLPAFRELEAAGIQVRIRRTDHPADRAFFQNLGHGPLPAWLLLEPGGHVRALRRGYTHPSEIHIWVRELMAEEDHSGLTRPAPTLTIPGRTMGWEEGTS